MRDDGVDVENLNARQKIAVEESRLGIPSFLGVMSSTGSGRFSHSLGQAAAWDDELIHEGSRILAAEARKAGIHWTFTPMMDIARDPRWGRIAEGYGEDTWLCSRFASIAVKAIQGAMDQTFGPLIA